VLNLKLIERGSKENGAVLTKTRIYDVANAFDWLRACLKRFNIISVFRRIVKYQMSDLIDRQTEFRRLKSQKHHEVAGLGNFLVLMTE